MRSRQPRRAKRTIVIGALASVALPIAIAPGARAAAPEPFNNGTANATSIVARIAPGVGALELSTAAGVAVTEVTHALAAGKAQSFDLGLIGSSLTAEQCNGQPAPVTPDQLPQPTLADNRKGTASNSSDEIPIAGTTLGAGREEVTASKQPMSRAVSTLADVNIPGLLEIGGGRAVAETAIVGGNAREAHSTVDADLDIGGIVQLHGLHWDALHRTGANPTQTASFSIGDAAVGSVPLPVDQLQGVQDAVNAALVPSGVTISFPHIEHLTSPNDLIRVTPMRILLKDSPLGKTAVGPVLNLTRAQREMLFDTVVGVYCNAAAALLTGDIMMSVVSGTGFLVVDIGGAEATTADVRFTNPFGNFVPEVLLNVPAVLGLPEFAGVFVPSPYTSGAAPASLATAPAASVPLVGHCESRHAFHWPPCSHGAALPIGLIGLAATVGVAGLDWRHQRRRATA